MSLIYRYLFLKYTFKKFVTPLFLRLMPFEGEEIWGRDEKGWKRAYHHDKKLILSLYLGSFFGRKKNMIFPITCSPRGLPPFFLLASKTLIVEALLYFWCLIWLYLPYLHRYSIQFLIFFFFLFTNLCFNISRTREPEVQDNFVWNIKTK